ncbi:hypothetical protein RhiirA4_545469 [Rhizophagus irregularis]|uniref:Uncharacterized protein n=1 Tax=Rhizophagus irregularis TaxID=588596 RepID=A0A2I1GSV7_9GLOM|nr:hypothetical protein RhiirA4_545469 [Rhizophagus irregularis]
MSKTCPKLKTQHWAGRKKLLDSVKKDLQKVVNSEDIFDETRKRKAREIWRLDHQILIAGNSGIQNIDSRQRKHHREDDEEPEKIPWVLQNIKRLILLYVDLSLSNNYLTCQHILKNLLLKALKLPKDEKRIIKSNPGHESSISLRQNDVKVDDIDMTLSKV